MNAQAPYALAAPRFRFRALAALAGRAALGGARELLLGALMAGRLVDGAVGDNPLPTTLRRGRAAAARTWLASLALPASSRATIASVIDATADDDRRALRDSWDGLLVQLAPALDLAARTELRRVLAPPSA